MLGNPVFQRYHEPFLGGGSFFFSLAAGRKAYLSDKNEALIETYESLRDNCEVIISHLGMFKNTKVDYYATRDQYFPTPAERAAQFIYLNQTSFNGIYRENLRGLYNVPYGNRTKPFLDQPALRAASSALRNAELKASDFAETLSNVRPGDLVFIDPPYTVSHNLNGFIKYNKTLFSLDDQYRLAQYIRDLRDIGAKYILTNAAHSKVREIFSFGDAIVEVQRASLVGGREAKRGQVSELLITNLGS